MTKVNKGRVIQNIRLRFKKSVDGRTLWEQIGPMRIHHLLCVAMLCLKFNSTGMAAAADPAGQQAAGIVAGVESGAGCKVLLNEKTNRLEVRDEQGCLIDEMPLGTAGKVVDVAGQEYRLSFGKDDMGRRSILVRAGPGMQKPVTVEILGRKSVLSVEASLLVTIDQKNRIYYEPSICGDIYMINKKNGTAEAVRL